MKTYEDIISNLKNSTGFLLQIIGTTRPIQSILELIAMSLEKETSRVLRYGYGNEDCIYNISTIPMNSKRTLFAIDYSEIYQLYKDWKEKNNSSDKVESKYYYKCRQCTLINKEDAFKRLNECTFFIENESGKLIVTDDELNAIGEVKI